VRTVLKQLVHCAVVPSPIRRSVTLRELERAQTMLHWMTVMTTAEDVVGIKPVRGNTDLFPSAIDLFLVTSGLMISDCSIQLWYGKGSN